MKPIAWTIAGSDTCSGAGIQADLKTFHDFDVHGCNIITALTAQNNIGVEAIQRVSADFLALQIKALQSMPAPSAIKIGMIGSKDNVQGINEFLKGNNSFVIYDPVFVSSSGSKLIDSIDSIKELLANIHLLTPNIEEAELLLNQSITTTDHMEQAARHLLEFGVQNVLIKGGHLGNDFAADFFCNQHDCFWLVTPRLKTKITHGTGCALSAAITAALTRGYELKDALVMAKMYVNQGIRLSHELPSGMNLFNHHGFPKHQQDLPWISHKVTDKNSLSFPNCGETPLGFYPIVDSSAWVEKLITWNVNTIQLRIKNKPTTIVEEEIKKSITLTKKNNCRLFINDYWQLAIKHQAYGVHLGQEDLNTANINKIHRAGLHLGISTHCFYEVARAHAFQPSYIAYGPIYETTSKPMAFSPRGLEQLRYWSALLNYPLVAIGGINWQRMDEVLSTGVKNVAVISAITKALRPDDATRQFLKSINVGCVSNAEHCVTHHKKDK